MSRRVPALSFFDYHASSVPPRLLDACATLFSSDYAVWSENGPRPGGKVKLTARQLKALLLFDPNTCRLAVAETLTGEVIAQAFYCNFPYKAAGWSQTQRVVWITQLVVKAEYRGQHIARKLLKAACSDKGLFACCLASCNPVAVLALYSAVGNHHDDAATATHAKSIINASKVPYLQGKQTSFCGVALPSSSVVMTDFHVCHPDVLSNQAVMKDWKLGSLCPGEEFLAVVFLPRT